LRVFTEKFEDSMTLPEYLRARFTSDKNDILLKLIVSGIFVVFFTIYSASGLIAGALLLKSIFSISYVVALLLITSIILVYTALGGFLAVNRIDFFQGILMLVALVIVPIVIFFNVDMPLDVINKVAPKHLDVFSNLNVLLVLSYVAWGLGYFGQPHILVRFMAVKSTKELPQARRICTSWMVLSLIGAISVGILGKALFPDSLNDPEIIFILSAKMLFNSFMTGILLSAVLSAIMSTISALLLMSASALVGDIYRTISTRNISDKQFIWLSRGAVAMLSLFSGALAYDGNSKVLSVVAFAWSGLGAAFGPVILLGLYYKKMSYRAAIAGMVTGAIVVLAWNMLVTNIFSAETLKSIKPGFELLPGFILSVLAILITSKIFPQKDPQILSTIDECLAENSNS